MGAVETPTVSEVVWIFREHAESLCIGRRDPILGRCTIATQEFLKPVGIGQVFDGLVDGHALDARLRVPWQAPPRLRAKQE